MVQETRLSQANAELATAQTQLDAKRLELDRVQAEYDKAMAEKQRLAGDADACRRKMANASALIEGLSGKPLWSHHENHNGTINPFCWTRNDRLCVVRVT